MPANQAPNHVHILELCALRVARGGLRIVDRLNLTLQGGEWLYATGPNGAGKTTLLRTFCALYPVVSGQVRWNGVAVREWGGEYGRNLQYLGHANALHPAMTAQENLAYCTVLRGVDATPQAVLDALDRMGLRALAARQAHSLSQGQQRRVALAALLLEPAPLWVLDEPEAALDTTGRALLAEMVCAHLCRGGMVVGTGHEPPEWGTPRFHLSLPCAV